MIGDAGVAPEKSLDVLDAGCGTGLCGALVAPYARRLVGVDLSDGMLALAREKNVYDDLVNGELTTYLRDHRGTFDLVVSADTLVYFGDLSAVADAAAHALRPGGMLVCTLEHAVDADPDVPFRLAFHGRYNHAQAYVERALTAAGFRATIAHAELRTEAGAPVAGLVVRAMVDKT
jgi:predicted TPR repeat methyltransferase